jgi:hypothetical protein
MNAEHSSFLLVRKVRSSMSSDLHSSNKTGDHAQQRSPALQVADERKANSKQPILQGISITHVSAGI